MLAAYRRHNFSVLDFFDDRPDRLLVMDMSRGDGWNKLAPFLNRPTPNTPYPHTNTTKEVYA
jgi:hypothetical protein